MFSGVSRVSNNVKYYTTDYWNKPTVKSNNNQQRRARGPGRQRIQAQKQKDAQITMRTQLLLEDTESLLEMTEDYLTQFIKIRSKKETKSHMNERVTTALMQYNIKVESMRDNAKTEGIDFTDAFKGAWVKVRNFEKQYESTFGDRQEAMARLPPIMKYMKATLKGKEVPTISYVKNAAFNGEVASNVLSNFNHTMNHVMPEKMDRITKNKGHYKKQQEQLVRQYKDDGDEAEYKFNDEELTRDFRGVKAKAMSGRQQKAMMEADTKRERNRAPNLDQETFAKKQKTKKKRSLFGRNRTNESQYQDQIGGGHRRTAHSAYY